MMAEGAKPMVSFCTKAFGDANAPSEHAFGVVKDEDGKEASG